MKYIIKIKINGGEEKEFDIVEFIDKNSLKTIEKELFNKMNNNKWCDEYMGKGLMGTVYSSPVSNKMTIKTSSNKKITIPIVIKNSNQNGELNIKTINKKMYIYAYKNITIEAIISSYINKLWYQQLSPHLPLMLGYSCCNNTDKISVDRIISERQGLPEKIKVKLSGYDEKPFWRKQENDRSIFKSNLATLEELIYYIVLETKNDHVILPNKEKCNTIELLDYLTISYLHTHNLLHKNNIIPLDMVFNNIYIHWLNENSYLDDIPLENIKYINYKIGKKIIKIKTHGILLKIGDVGSFIITPKKDLFILGHVNELEENLDLIKYIIKPNHNCYLFLTDLKYMMPFSLYKKTIAFQIISKYPYDVLFWSIPIPYKVLNDFLTPEEILKNYSKYFIDKIEDNKHTLIVEEF